MARHRARSAVGARRDPGPWGQRLLERIPGRALPPQLQGGRDLRRNEPAPHADSGRLRARVPRGPSVAVRAVAGTGLGAPAAVSDGTDRTGPARWVPASPIAGAIAIAALLVLGATA